MKLKKYSDNEIIAKAKEIWIRDFYYDDEMKLPKVNPPEIKVEQSNGEVRLTVSRMYDSPRLSYDHFQKLREFFDTNNINDDDRFSYGGCETCDYGSSYGFTLTIRNPFKEIQ